MWWWLIRTIRVNAILHTNILRHIEAASTYPFLSICNTFALLAYMHIYTHTLVEQSLHHNINIENKDHCYIVCVATKKRLSEFHTSAMSHIWRKEKKSVLLVHFRPTSKTLFPRTQLFTHYNEIDRIAEESFISRRFSYIYTRIDENRSMCFFLCNFEKRFAGSISSDQQNAFSANTTFYTL